MRLLHQTKRLVDYLIGGRHRAIESYNHIDAAGQAGFHNLQAAILHLPKNWQTNSTRQLRAALVAVVFLQHSLHAFTDRRATTL